MSNRKYVIGIDPSLVNMGVCIYNPKTKKMLLHTSDMMSAIEWLMANVGLDLCYAVVECPHLNTNVFGGWPMIEPYIRKANVGGAKSVFGTITKRARDVGENAAAGKFICRYLKSMGVPVLEVSPSQRQKAFKWVDNPKEKGKTSKRRINVLMLKKPTKTTKDQFRILTNYKGQSDEHNRDAATLVWGLTLAWLDKQAAILKRQEEKQPNKPSATNENFYLLKRSTSNAG